MLHNLQGCRARRFILSYDRRARVRAPAGTVVDRVGAVVPDGLLQALAQVPDPRDPRGVRYRLATLLAIGVCTMTSASRPKVPVLTAYPHADHRP